MDLSISLVNHSSLTGDHLLDHLFFVKQNCPLMVTSSRTFRHAHPCRRQMQFPHDAVSIRARLGCPTLAIRALTDILQRRRKRPLRTLSLTTERNRRSEPSFLVSETLQMPTHLQRPLAILIITALASPEGNEVLAAKGRSFATSRSR